jgi:hypothetical protein
MNSDFPDVNFHDWHAKGSKGIERIVTVNATQWAIFRGDFEQYRNVDVDGAGVLELTTQSVAQGGDYIKAYGQGLGEEFGKLRIIEIIGGDTQWDQQTVTYNNFFQGHGYSDLFNTQMIIDGELSEDPGSKNFIPLSKPVMQRLLNGKTKGLLIRPLGSLDVSVYASDSPSDATGPKLHFNTKP